MTTYYQITIPATDEVFLKEELEQAQRWIDRNIKHHGFGRFGSGDEIELTYYRVEDDKAIVAAHIQSIEVTDDEVNWFDAYHEALGALMFHDPELAKKIDSKYKVKS